MLLSFRVIYQQPLNSSPATSYTVFTHALTSNTEPPIIRQRTDKRVLYNNDFFMAASMSLSKTQKRTDNNIRLALTHACEQSLKDIAGFEWLTHQVDYTHFPGSLFITCVFSDQQAQQNAIVQGNDKKLQKLIVAKLFAIGIKLSSIKQQVILDNEEACMLEHNGDWKLRLASRKGRTVARNRP
ncbi:hypothetical protein [Marinagarivorans algicola]|uniref:hypothetical protein n=1 Tax=Marinagarivorans algicola TaxID=1513270 RepID=UPI001FD5C1A7|nr:hypothetical protein [Marinagarivorans algicola]